MKAEQFSDMIAVFPLNRAKSSTVTFLVETDLFEEASR
jgi:hypothetical protein